MFDCKKIDISADGDMEKDTELEHLVAKLAAFSDDANKDALAIFKEWVLDAQLEQCARTNNAQRAQQLVVNTPARYLIACLMQAAARGHVEVLKVFAHHTSDCEDRFHGLEAAAYFNRVECVQVMLPYCLSSDDEWMLRKGVNAAIDGGNYELAHVLMPHIDVTKKNSAAFRYAVRGEEQELAELFYPYSDIADVLNHVRNEDDSDTIKQMVQWIETYESKRLAQRIETELQHHTHTPTTVKKM